ncbi:MAG: hypothetical protein M3O91_01745, partial [Chloroflexota bacterium]|nr:hypothetical protein [Chloroflexota bacterium]
MTFETPEALDALAVNGPALLAQERPDGAVPPARMRRGAGVHRAHQLGLFERHERAVSLGRAVLAEESAGPALGDPVPAHQILRGGPPSRRAHHFPRCRS